MAQQSGIKSGLGGPDKSKDVERTIDSEIDEGQREGENRTDVDDEARLTADEASVDDERDIKTNRERLNVNEEHKTPEMQKGHRGTYP